MIESIKWPPGSQSPFLADSDDYTLKITLHSSSFKNLTKEEEAAIALLKEFSNLPEIDIMDTTSSEFPNLKVGEPNEDDDIPYRIIRKEEPYVEEDLFYTMYSSPAHSKSALGGRLDYPVSNDQWKLIRLGWCHTHLKRHLFVTKSPFLLGHRSELWIGTINPRTPLEAAKILGTFLRSMDDYTYHITPQGQIKHSYERPFYYALTRHRAPILWKFLDACGKAGTERKDDLDNIGAAVAFRCFRAMSARDKIGSAFYSTASIDRIEKMAYHFDYLCLLVSGAFDALGIIAKRAYDIDMPDRDVSFRKNRYSTESLITELQAKGATDLYKVISGYRFQNVLYILSLLRNTIHGPALRMTSNYASYLDTGYVIRIPSEMGKKLWRTTSQLGTPERWGLMEQRNKICIEPYSFATALVDEELRYVEAIASAIPIEKLFPDPDNIPEIDSTLHPGVEEFKWLDRFALLA